MPPPLLLIGASVRAAAGSARRAGFSNLFAVDLFADADLARLCPTRRLDADAYPFGFIRILADLPDGPVVYTGALENHPRVLSALSRERPLWGNGPEVLRQVRDPFAFARALKEAGLPHAQVRREPGKKQAGAWLVKPFRSAGGAGIRLWEGGPLRSGQYLQEYRPGLPGAAIFCGFPPGEALLLGWTWQLVGTEWTGAKPFQYCGSVFPFGGPSLDKELAGLGTLLVQRFGLRGLFGVDFLFSEAVIPLEVNPRYTASIEILERSTELQSMAWHRAAFDPSTPRPPFPPRQPRNSWAKAILFARQALVFPTPGPWEACLKPEASAAFHCDYADIPPPGTKVEQGHPILTVFAEGPTHDSCLTALRQKVAETETRLYP